MTENSTDFRFDDTGLQNLLRVLESDHSVRVGVFGGAHTAARKEAGALRKNGGEGGRNIGKGASDTTNAEIGFLMEYGAPKRKIPARSWLRMPLMSKINQIVKDSAKYFEASVKDGDSIKFLTILGVNAEKWIGLAFDSKGFGSWAANRPATVARKGSASPLIDTGQLRRAVTSMVI